MIRAVIVEDEPRNVDVLTNLLQRYCKSIEVVAVANNVEQAISVIEKEAPELIFLDVELPDGSGFNVLENFPAKQFNVIFVTAYEHYAIKAIKFCALDYILKPIDIDDLVNAVNKVNIENQVPNSAQRKEVLLANSRQDNTFKQKIALPTLEGLQFVRLEDVIMCVGEGNYTTFVLSNKSKLLASKPLTFFEELLSDEQFYRVHKSYLVNLMYVDKYVKGRGGYLVMQDGTKVEVSTRLKADFLQRFVK
jgi:two-component system LytT family response regulator